VQYSCDLSGFQGDGRQLFIFGNISPLYDLNLNFSTAFIVWGAYPEKGGIPIEPPLDVVEKIRGCQWGLVFVDLNLDVPHGGFNETNGVLLCIAEHLKKKRQETQFDSREKDLRHEFDAKNED
jgi:formylmethanofuran dehydrogenase subunit B